MRKVFGFMLEQELSDSLDKFLDEHSDYMHRSHFVIKAIEEKLERER